jgi:hypothetical protein
MAAKPSKTSSVRSHIARPRKKRPGVHSKKKSSKSKSSKNYFKRYAGQGK